MCQEPGDGPAATTDCHRQDRAAVCRLPWVRSHRFYLIPGPDRSFRPPEIVVCRVSLIITQYLRCREVVIVADKDKEEMDAEVRHPRNPAVHAILALLGQ